MKNFASTPENHPDYLCTWFNGTHRVRVLKANSDIGVRVETLMCDGNGYPQKGAGWERYSPSQNAWYKDMATVLAEGYRNALSQD